MKRERPPMPPMDVRLQVATRQFVALFPAGMLLSFKTIRQQHGLTESIQNQLRSILTALFGESDYALDHDPALILRPYNPRIRDVAARYTPHAHDPDALIYREKADHQQKTTGRKPGAERTVTTKGSDIWVKTKFARLEKPRKPRTTIKPRGFGTRPKQKIPSRPFPKRRTP